MQNRDATVRRHTTIAIIAGTVVAAAAIAVALYVLGVVPFGSRSAIPSCDRLPTVAEAETALDAHPSLVRELDTLGDDITIAVERPCGDADAAVIEITYSSNDEREAIDQYIATHDGFGVPLTLARR